jgi:putative glutamine amidotransferase
VADRDEEGPVSRVGARDVGADRRPPTDRSRPRIGVTTGTRVHGDRRFEAVDRAYVTAVVAAGGLPVLLPVLDPALAEPALADVDGLLLSGGGDVAPARYGQAPVPEVTGVDTERDAWELALVGVALRGDLPVLGVCRGCQVLAVATGGSLVQHLPADGPDVHDDAAREAEPVHEVRLTPGSAVACIVGAERVDVNSMHHQAVARLGDALRAVGWSRDGVVEAIEAPSRSVVGVQWHPEHLTDRPPHRALFAWLVGASR